MTQTEMIILIVAGIVVLALIVGAIVMSRRRARTAQLHRQFGSEYDKVVEETGDRDRAEQELVSRNDRVRRFDLKPLTQADQERYSRRWRQIESRFLEQPTVAVADAQWLLEEVMRLRGYEIHDIDQQQADLSVLHPDLVDDFRAARAIADASETGNATTEDMRQAMVHYKGLFSALLQQSPVRS